MSQLTSSFPSCASSRTDRHLQFCSNGIIPSFWSPQGREKTVVKQENASPLFFIVIFCNFYLFGYFVKGPGGGWGAGRNDAKMPVASVSTASLSRGFLWFWSIFLPWRTNLSKQSSEKHLKESRVKELENALIGFWNYLQIAIERSSRRHLSH